MKRYFFFSIFFLLQILSPISAQTWKSLTKDNSDLPSNAINFIYFDDDPSIWFCTQDSGLVHYQNGAFTRRRLFLHITIWKSSHNTENGAIALNKAP